MTAGRIVARTLAGLLLAAGCEPLPQPARDTVRSAGPAPAVDTVASGLEVPWAIAFAPDGRIFVSERVGRIRVIAEGTLRPEPWATVPVAARGEAGLMGIAVAPDFATSRAVYAVATVEQRGGLVNRVLRMSDENGKAGPVTVILDGIPAAVFHAGDAIAFGPDGMLYVATGDAREPRNAQDTTSLAGKVLRMRPDGTVPPDNPIPGSLIYARGVRNMQGITWDPTTGQMFGTDHGPSGFPNERFRQGRDELNAIPHGGNLGWPAVAGGSDNRRFTPPLVDWSDPGIAPAGVATYAGPHSSWSNSVFVAALKGEQLRRVTLARDSTAAPGWRAVADEPLVEKQFGRLRAVAMGPDGMVYFTTSNRDGRGAPRSGDDHLLRLRPATNPPNANSPRP
ncbi:MAG TPA: PQQ-dependent sugar dehydrogenase [Gemmatimonadaceae bacterium]|nr:PQQ-dependent sugar dehydrogenase [Gemmatimonadaceae bacterium]